MYYQIEISFSIHICHSSFASRAHPAPLHLTHLSLSLPRCYQLAAAIFTAVHHVHTAQLDKLIKCDRTKIQWPHTRNFGFYNNNNA